MKSTLFSLVALFFVTTAFSPASPSIKNKEAKSTKIQVALLLDTSNSMDGLIDQAKSQLWKMVNELATSKKDGKSPDIEIALYEYGNDNLSAKEGYIRQVSPMTDDLDLISEKLFELSTRGGSEYCGWVIGDATKQLEWTNNNDDLKLIIIAGNESFAQGPKDYKETCKKAITNGIMINTIFCGDYNRGVELFWKNGADITDGQYMNIDTDAKVVHVKSPYDDKILELNQKLNDTYIGYGNLGNERKTRQMVQDQNAAQYSDANMVERAVSKSSAAYKADSWDLVDAMEEDEEILDKVKKEDLPEEMKKMSKAERKKYIETKKKERETLQKEINKLNAQRQTYVAKERKENAETLTLDNVMLKAIREQAESKNYEFEKQ